MAKQPQKDREMVRNRRSWLEITKDLTREEIKFLEIYGKIPTKAELAQATRSS